MMKSIFIAIFCIVLLAPFVMAEQVTFSVKQLNASLQQQFPFTRQYEGVLAEFYQPKLQYLYLDNEMKIFTKIKLTYQNQTLLAEGLLVDEAELEKVSNTLRFDHPKLDEFYLLQDNMSNSAEAIKVLKQTIGITLPPIQLLNLEGVDLSITGNQASRFSLEPQGLVITF